MMMMLMLTMKEDELFSCGFVDVVIVEVVLEPDLINRHIPKWQMILSVDLN